MAENNKEYLTKEKYDEITKELEYLRHTKRKEIAENLEYAKSLGDLSENAEYHEARDSQAELEDRINHLEHVLKTAEIVSSHKGDIVMVGSQVVVEKQDDNSRHDFTIVGSEEADISLKKLSVKSPFGDAILKKAKGELFSVLTPKGKIDYKIISIN